MEYFLPTQHDDSSMPMAHRENGVQQRGTLICQPIDLLSASF
jgi:hypothetical protein